ncbi:MAG: hypothetical protein H0V17_29895, partial [Deltaproteobacteria bacterium]|nr:hypothetical protein [Deltaproteobacteria bacterium]
MAKSKMPTRKPARGKAPARPPPVPRNSTVKRFALGLPGASLIAHAKGELVFSNGSDSAFVDAQKWPPSVVIHHGQHVRFAARGDAGQWLAYTTQDSGKATWTLRWFDSIAVAHPSKEERDPMPARDLTPFYVELDEERKRSEVSNKARLESVDFCGPFALIVPRHVGLGDYRRPYVLAHGTWVEDRNLPPIEKQLADVTTTHPTRSTTILDGPHVVVWNDQVFVPLHGIFTEMFSDRISLGRRHSTPVPAVGGGLFALQGTGLVEASIDTVREHLPGVSACAVQRGPDGTVVVEAETGPLLYDPIKNEVADLGNLVADGDVIAGALDSDLIVFDGRACEIRRITR